MEGPLQSVAGVGVASAGVLAGGWGAGGFYSFTVVLSLHGAVGPADLCGDAAAAVGIDMDALYASNAYQNKAAWVAVSGEITLSLYPATDGMRHPSASAELTDVVLSHNDSRQRHIIRSVEIPKVTVGYWRL